MLGGVSQGVCGGCSIHVGPLTPSNPLSWATWTPPVLEYGVWWTKAGGDLQRYRTEGLGETVLEVGGLEPGTRYEFQVRARTSSQWLQYSTQRLETTMAPFALANKPEDPRIAKKKRKSFSSVFLFLLAS